MLLISTQYCLSIYLLTKKSLFECLIKTKLINISLQIWSFSSIPFWRMSPPPQQPFCCSLIWMSKFRPNWMGLNGMSSVGWNVQPPNSTQFTSKVFLKSDFSSSVLLRPSNSHVKPGLLQEFPNWSTCVYPGLTPDLSPTAGSDLLKLRSGRVSPYSKFPSVQTLSQACSLQEHPVFPSNCLLPLTSSFIQGALLTLSCGPYSSPRLFLLPESHHSLTHPHSP